jgi:hypothetical protein
LFEELVAKGYIDILILPTRKPNIPLMSASEYLYIGYHSGVSQNMYLLSQSLNILISGCHFGLKKKQLSINEKKQKF